MTTITFGSGGTYATLAAAAAAITGLDSVWNLVQVGDTTEVAQSLFTPKVNGQTINIYSDTPHGGNPNGGHIINTFDPAGSIHVVFQGWLAGVYWNVNYNLTNLNFKGTSSTNYIVGAIQNNGEDYVTLTMNKCIIIDNAVTKRGLSCGEPSLRVYSSKISSYAQLNDNTTVNAKILENCSFGDVDLNSYKSTVRNCASWSFVDSSNSLGYNNKRIANAMVDGDWYTGSSGNTGNLVAADEFKSTVETENDYLFINNDGELADGGTPPVYVTEDIAGIPIPNYVERNGVKLTDDIYPTGCHQGKYLPGTYQVVLDNSIQGVPDAGVRPLPVNFQYNEQYVVEEL